MTTLQVINAQILSATEFYNTPLGKSLAPDVMQTNQRYTVTSIANQLQTMEALSNQDAMELNNVIAASLFSEPMKQLLVQAVLDCHQGKIKLEKDGGSNKREDRRRNKKADRSKTDKRGRWKRKRRKKKKREGQHKDEGEGEEE